MFCLVVFCLASLTRCEQRRCRDVSPVVMNTSIRSTPYGVLAWPILADRGDQLLMDTKRTYSVRPYYVVHTQAPAIILEHYRRYPQLSSGSSEALAGLGSAYCIYMRPVRCHKCKCCLHTSCTSSPSLQNLQCLIVQLVFAPPLRNQGCLFGIEGGASIPNPFEHGTAHRAQMEDGVIIDWQETVLFSSISNILCLKQFALVFWRPFPHPEKKNNNNKVTETVPRQI